MISPYPMQDRVRYDLYGEVRLLAAAEGYVMVRRPNCRPYVLSTMQWQMMRSTPATPNPYYRRRRKAADG